MVVYMYMCADVSANCMLAVWVCWSGMYVFALRMLNLSFRFGIAQNRALSRRPAFKQSKEKQQQQQQQTPSVVDCTCCSVCCVQMRCNVRMYAHVWVMESVAC